MRVGRFDGGIRALRSTLKLNGETADRQANLGEALTGAANGVITSDAKAAFERALALDASNPRAQFYLGLAAEQDGRTTDAVERGRKLLPQAPADAPWVAYVRQALARLDPNATTPPPRGPTAQD